MAIIDITKSKTPNIADRDTNIKIGIDLPIRKGDNLDGYFATTDTTSDAIKNNIRNLLMTNYGERLMQPTFGINLRKYVFMQISAELILQIQDEILDTLDLWLPFVRVKNILVNTHQTNSNIDPNTMKIAVVFAIGDTNFRPQTVDINVTAGIRG